MGWRFYTTDAGKPVVKDELRRLGHDAEAQLLATARRVEAGTALAREDEALWGDVRAVRQTVEGCEYRLMYAREGDRGQVLLGLYAYNKKTRQVPRTVRRLVDRRLRDWRERGARQRASGTQSARGEWPKRLRRGNPR